MSNKLIIAGAGTGKSTFIIEKALELSKDKKILITTYTNENEEEIKKKMIKKEGCIPANIKIQTWWSFLLKHGVKPYQGIMFEQLYDKNIKGLNLVSEKSGTYKVNGKIYPYPKTKIEYYFSKQLKIYSDKISDFIINCNEKSKGAVIKRLETIYDYLYVDEVQDLAGYDLEIIKLLFKSNINIELVGDPRQVTYLTHNSTKNKKFRNGKIKDYLLTDKKLSYDLEETRLTKSHRNNFEICNFANKLYPEYPKIVPCDCCHKYNEDHEGIYVVGKERVEKYLEKYDAVQLRNDRKTLVNEKFKYLTFGKSKGITLNRVLIYPTKAICDWLKNPQSELKDSTRAKLYVAITRAKYSVAFVVSCESEYLGIEGIFVAKI